MIRHPDDMPRNRLVVGVNAHALTCVDDDGSVCCVCGLSPDDDRQMAEWEKE